jgi:hypothetical protein
MDNVDHRNKWIEGINPGSFYKDFLINKQISLQFRILDSGDESIKVYKLNSAGTYTLFTTLIAIDITPYGWISEDVNRYDFTPSLEGVYYMDFEATGFLSDKFIVNSQEIFTRKLIEIVFYNSENDYGMIFFDESTQKYTGRTYFTGQLLPGAPGNESSVFNSDRGQITKLRATPIRNAILKICDLHYTYLDNINMIFSCDNILVNGIAYQNADVMEVEDIAKSDLKNVTVKLSQVNNDYYTM